MPEFANEPDKALSAAIGCGVTHCMLEHPAPPRARLKRSRVLPVTGGVNPNAENRGRVSPLGILDQT